MDTRPFRSVLYVPGSNARALQKATLLPADAIIFDLEDAVAEQQKADARALLARTLGDVDYGARAKLVRINALETRWGRADLDVLAAALPPEAILLPKASSAADVAALARMLDARPETADTRIWAMLETPLGALNALEIARAPRMAGFVMGTNDLAASLGCRERADRMALLSALQMCLIAARVAGIVAVDGVFNAFQDQDGLRAECQQGRDMGFDGKSLIHPNQLAVANAVFAPSPTELDLARRQIAAFEAAQARGEGVAVVDGRIVENLHIVSARRALERGAAISAIREEM